mmetsp:Transcript_4213/g.5377  ORF Transcript_4213/g.5377 Transcript_4213/m.5377 type:complete len:281 (+) Transcript_4213:100-942(+)
MALNSIKDGVMDTWLHFRTGNDRNDQTCLYIESNSNPKSKGEMMPRSSLPPKNDNSIRFVVISDTHTRHHSLGILPEGDVFVHSGDILMSTRFWSSQGRRQKYEEFNNWLGSDAIQCPNKIIVGGNHDAELEQIGYSECMKLFSNGTYLENTSIIVKTKQNKEILIYGSPSSNGHSGNSAFQSQEFTSETMRRSTEEGGKHMARPSSQYGAVLVTHGPCKHLRKPFERNLKAHIWGHAHGAYGAKHFSDREGVLSICASTMDTRYCPTNAPIVMDISLPP